MVYGKDGLDEVSLGATTVVGELKDGKIREYELHPEDFGVAMSSHRALKVATPQESKAMLMSVLNNEDGPPKDIVCLNAGVALYAANVVDTVQAGLELAKKTIATGAAKERLNQMISFTQGVGKK